MKKILKILFLTLILILFSIQFANASSVNMDIETGNISNNESNNIMLNDDYNNISNTATNKASSQGPTTIITTTHQEEFLTIENILSIIIIVIGIILIFLGIAILIRCK